MKLLSIIFILVIAIPFLGCGSTSDTKSLNELSSDDSISLALSVLDAPLEGVTVNLNSFQRGLLAENISDSSGFTVLKISRGILSSLRDEDILYLTATATQSSKVHLEDSVKLLQPGQVMLKSFLPPTADIKKAMVKNSQLDKTDEFKEYLVVSHLTTAESWLVEEALINKNLISTIIEVGSTEINHFNSSELGLVSSLRDSIKSGLRQGFLGGKIASKYQLYALCVKAMIEDSVTYFLVNQSNMSFAKSGKMITYFIKNRRFSLSEQLDSQLVSLKNRLNADLEDPVMNSSISSALMKERLISEQVVSIKSASTADLSEEFVLIVDPITKTVIPQTAAEVSLEHIVDDSNNGSELTTFSADLVSGSAVIDVEIPCDEGRIRC